MTRSFNQITLIGSNMYYPIKVVSLFLIVIGIFVTPSFASINQDSQGLAAIPTEHFDSFRMSDNAKLPASKKIFINDVSANFSSEWLVKFSRDTSEQYQSKILQDYSQMLKQHIKAKLILSGWEVLDSYEDGVITVSAQLKNLYINGPEILGRRHMLVKNIGQSSIEIIVKDADKQPIIIIEDKRNTRSEGSFLETNNATNYSWFNRLTNSWATMFVAYLDMTTAEITGKS